MFVTVELLKKLKACEKERNRFAELFPVGVKLSRTVIVRHAQEFDWDWCAKNLASPAGYAAYRRTEKPVWDAYIQAEYAAYAASQQVWAAYKLACATAFADVMGL